MKLRKTWMLAAILTLCGLSVLFVSCNSRSGSLAKDISSVAGTLDGPLPADSAPFRVLEAMERAECFHQYEIMSDTTCHICVEAIAEADATSTEGYGIVVTKGATSTTFPNLCNARCPMAAYDKQHGWLWLTSSAMWGTGVQVDWLYQIRFDKDDKAYIAHIVNPYDIQQQLLGRLGYTIEGEQITLYDGEREIAQATNTVTDMGGFDDEQHPVWIGEQITYDLAGPTPCLLVTPGIKFTTGLVLTYDDMPTLTALLTIADDGTLSIGDISVAETDTTVTAEMAYEGVNNYCHSAYDWSPSEANPSLMSITMGEETETEYEVVFRSYTGALVYFYVEKANGRTRMVEHVPALNVESEAGSIDLFDYLK
ncbi:MAG: hypothetical protein IJ064_05155 [Bacteroidaceae bacterium]|nr:hypothetical protein [Bacteroidaceae bacterium]